MHPLAGTGKVAVTYLFELWQNHQTPQPLACHYRNSISRHTKPILLYKLLAFAATFAVMMIIMMCFPNKKTEYNVLL